MNAQGCILMFTHVCAMVSALAACSQKISILNWILGCVKVQAVHGVIVCKSTIIPQQAVLFTFCY